MWRFVPAGPCRDAVEASLRFADGRATAAELAAARSAAMGEVGRAGPNAAAAWAAVETTNPSAFHAARTAAAEAAEQIRQLNPRAADDECRAQAGFLRDVVGDPFEGVPIEAIRYLGRDPLVREIAEGIYEGAPAEDATALADVLARLGCASEAALEHCRSGGPHVRGCWVIDLLLGADDLPPLPAETVPRVTAAWLQEARAAFSEYLGLKRYRRTLRKAVGAAFDSGRIGRPGEWNDFVRRHPLYDVPEDRVAAVFTLCAVHGCELEQRPVRGPFEDPVLLRDREFKEARGTRFPYSHPEETVEERERIRWVCPECQAARAAWVAGRASPASPAVPAQREEPPPLEPPRFPVGEYVPDETAGPDRRAELIAQIAAAPAALRAAVAGLWDDQLDTRYRNWTVRQIVHHVGDSHLNSLARFKWALTEERPTIKAYDEARWVEMDDARTGDVSATLTLLDGLHARWVRLLRSLTEGQFARTFLHPETGDEIPLFRALGYYAWHGRHHTGQILWLRDQRGW